MKLGTIIFLNGGSSSGKSSISKILQETLDGYFLHTGVDHYMERLAPKFDVVSDGLHPAEADGFLLVFPEGGNRITEIRPGHIGINLLTATYHAYAALAARGIDLIIDDVLFDPRMLKSAVAALAPFSVLFVGVRCPPDEAERREQLRGDRAHGLARAHAELVHAHGVYDLEVDTLLHSPEACAAQIREHLLHGPVPDAFERLRQSQGF